MCRVRLYVLAPYSHATAHLLAYEWANSLQLPRSASWIILSTSIGAEMTDEEPGTASATSTGGNLKNLIKESIRELLHEEPALLDSDRSRGSDCPPGEGMII